MTLRIYAKQKGWSLDRITVRLRYYRIHAEYCIDCETKVGFVDWIEREIEVGGNLDLAQKNRLRAIAESCPVYRGLAPAIDIQTAIV